MRNMKAVFRSLLLWLMLLAIPFQGVASAGMLLCAPGPAPASAQVQDGAPAMAADHDHAAMLAAAAEAHAGHEAAQAGSDAGGGVASTSGGHGVHDSHGPAKCGSTGACCVGAALAPALPGVLPEMAAPSQSIPFYSGRLPLVDLALPERPPQAVHV